MDMLCIAALHDPPGFIAINGNGIDVGTLARMVGASAQTVEPLIAELEGNGVFSRDRNGVIYSRRMVRDVKRLKTAQKHGRLGGNPTLCGNRRNSGEDNPPDKPRDKPPDKAHKPRSQESRSQKERDLSLSGEARSRTRDGPRGSIASAARRMAEMVDDNSARTPAAQIGRKSR
jgi:hypothetical protein